MMMLPSWRRLAKTTLEPIGRYPRPSTDTAPSTLDTKFAVTQVRSAGYPYSDSRAVSVISAPGEGHNISTEPSHHAEHGKHGEQVRHDRQRARRVVGPGLHSPSMVERIFAKPENFTMTIEIAVATITSTEAMVMFTPTVT